MAATIRILTADDHPVLRDGVAAIVEMQDDMTIVGEAASGAEAIAAFERLRPDVTLMDLQMPMTGGIEAITAIREKFSTARIIVLTTYESDVQAVRAFKAGAAGYLLKSSLRKQLLDAIRAVHAGHRHIPPEIAQEIALHIAEEPLSEREIAVLRLVAAGNANKTVAWELKIAEDTVKAHLKNIFDKLGAKDRTHAVSVAVKRGVIVL